MSFTVEWAWPARRMLLERLPWPASSDVAIAVHRFARERAPHLHAGRHGLRAAGYDVGMRVNDATRTVLVLYIYRRR
jgi:hypothetical protein